MKRKTHAIVLVGLVSLVLALATNEVAAQAITVTPADPTISVGQTQQFTATGIDTAAAIAGGAFHQCALLQDTTVRCWGLNDYGQLGNGSIADPPGTPNPTPVAVVGLTGVAAVTGGGFHTCARFPDGTVQCWGRNSEGQLGDPATTAFASPTPVRVTGITAATAVKAGGFHTCALLPNGTVQCWGLNDFGQLGNGTVSPSQVRNPNPVQVSGITTAVSISAGGWHTCALLQNGTVRCWGDNERGQVGDGTPTPGPPFIRRATPTPVEVVGITTAVAIESGIFHTCALLEDGRVQCWGWNEFGQLGNDPPARNASSTPVTVSGLTSPAALAPGAEHTCALLVDGAVLCWGDNNFGQNGNGSPRAQGSTNPGASAPVTGITTATAVASGAEHSCALLPGGTVQCWGRNDFGRLGVGLTAPGTQPCPEDSASCALTPVTVGGLGVTWESSDPTVATIDANGRATGGRAGSTTIRATSDGRSGSTLLTVVDDPTVTRVTLAVARNGTGGGTVTSSDGRINCGTTCSASYNSGDTVTLTATPDANSTFAGWTGGGCSGSGTGPCTVTLTENTAVTATFNIQRFTLAVARNGTGSGTVTSSDGRINCGGGGSCSATYDSGSSVTLTATPATGSTFGGWTGGGCSGTAPCTVTVSANTTVTATFNIQRFMLTVNRTGLGSGTVTSSDGRINCGGGGSCSATYDFGTLVTLTAKANLLSAFAGWSGGCSGTSTTCTLTLRMDTTVTASFRLLGLL